jgi:t-SNARE complex subunit (syntaxin)
VRNVPTVNHSQPHGSNTSHDLQDNIDEDGNDKMKGKSRYEPPRSSLFQQHMTNRDNSHKQPISNSAYAMNISSPYAFNANQNAAQPQQTGQIQKPVTTESRLHHAQRIESSIREMGQLFSQMASLIAEQSEVITRIEDDVEIGHQNTVEGYSSIQQAYEITKGNRGMIIKIFLILIFCIFLFLVWT